MLGRGVARLLDGSWAVAFDEVRLWLAEADLAFVNLESPLTTAPYTGSRYDLRAMPSAVAALQAAGLDAVSLANNHALDGGEAGLAETIETLSAAGIAGVRDWHDGLLVSRRGSEQVIRYRLLAFDDSVVPLDVESAVQATTAAARRADLVIVSVHWGIEYQTAPSPRQTFIASALAGAGAHLVIGHGPHVLQRIERIGRTLVAYSLGNLLFDQLYPADCRQGVILRVTWFPRRGHFAAAAFPTVVERGRVWPANSKESLAILARLGLE